MGARAALNNWPRGSHKRPRASRQGQPKKSADLRGALSGKDFKFAPGKSYIVTSALAFEETRQLTLWQQVGDNSLSWGQAVQLYEQNKSKIEWDDTA